ncbi:MAG: response regulator [Verrucomicrobiaceae bacterium]|jgi:two-component system response regulator MprA|nr:MAG: response regulator [Verrucomicrobiaceae bacterium]
MRVLIADDDRDLVEAIAEYVRECGHEVCATVTGGGLAVIQSFARYLPDVVILDIMMPRFNGITTCHALLSRKPDTKVIFMSGKVESDHPFVMSCGAVAYLHKPILLEDVREVLGALASQTLIPLPSASVAA